MGKLHIVLDCDGVLLNWHKGFISYSLKYHGLRLNALSPMDSYDMHTWFNNMSKETFIRLVSEYNSYPRVLEPCRGAIESIQDLASYEDLEFSVLTSFGSCPHMSNFRQEYLQVVFNNIFKEVRVLKLRECKRQALIEMNPDVFVEDCAEYAITGRELGIKTYLVNTTYNQGVEGVTYIDSLEDLVYLNSKGELT
jgi:FMN phosphatase YigB (HAD superfamily)